MQQQNCSKFAAEKSDPWYQSMRSAVVQGQIQEVDASDALGSFVTAQMILLLQNRLQCLKLQSEVLATMKDTLAVVNTDFQLQTILLLLLLLVLLFCCYCCFLFV